MTFEDKGPAFSGTASCSFHADDIAASQKFREHYETLTNVVKAEDMPWERSPDGLIKHLVHHKLSTRECCVEAYMQFLKAGERSGKHRHMWEEVIFVVEGSGSMKIDGNNFQLTSGTIVVTPSWAERVINASEDLVLFSYSDRATQQKLSIWREQLS